MRKGKKRCEAMEQKSQEEKRREETRRGKMRWIDMRRDKTS